MRKLLFAISLLSLCNLFVSADAAIRSSRKVEAPVVVQISDETVVRVLDQNQLAQWNQAQSDLKKAENNMRSAKWLLDRQPGTGSMAIDVSGAHEAGKKQMAEAQSMQAKAKKTLEDLRLGAQKRADYLALVGPEYEYEKSSLGALGLSDFCDVEIPAFIEGLHARNYYVLYFAETLRWDADAYVPAASSLNDRLLSAMITADGKNYSLIVPKGFALQQTTKGVRLKPQGFDAPTDNRKAAVIVAELFERPGADPLLSLRAVDLDTWKILDSRTYQLSGERGASDTPIDLVFADKSKFLDSLTAQPQAFLFQLDFKDAKQRVSRECSLLFKAAAAQIPGVNLSDGDFFALAYPPAANTAVAKAPLSVNALWRMNPAKPAPVLEQPKEEVKPPESKRGSNKQVAQETPPPPKKESEIKGDVLLLTPLMAFNPTINSEIDVGEFAVCVDEKPAAAASQETTE